MSEYMRGGGAAHVPAVSRSAAKTKGRPSLIKQQARMQWWSQGCSSPPTILAFMEAPLQILWRKKKEGENFEEEEEGMRGGRRKGEPPMAPPLLGT